MVDSSNYWLNGRQQTALDIRPAGPGNNWQILDTDAGMTAPSGGRQGVDSAWGRAPDGSSRYLGTRFTGNPERWTFDVMARVDNINYLLGLLDDLDGRLQCGCVTNTNDVRVRERCGDQRDIQQYTKWWLGLDAASTSSSFDNPLANAMEGDNIEVQQQESLSAGLAVRGTKLVHNDISGTVSDVALNKTIFVCSDEWWLTGNADNTPGYIGQPTPKVIYTEDGGSTFTAIDVPVFLNGNITDMIKVGSYIVVVSATNGVAYAPITQLKRGGVIAPAAWSLATGFTAPNFPRTLFATNSNVVWAAGAGGRIWKSSDGGFSFTAQTSPTSNNLFSIAFASDDLGWFVGASGTVVRYFKGSFSVLAISGLSATINKVAVPEYRGNEVYLGTANGFVYRSRNAAETSPTWETRGFQGSGTGQIIDLQFAGWKGNVLFLIQSDLNGLSRVLRDLSGGALGLDTEPIGDFQTPSNFGYTSIAPANENDAMVVGNIHETYAFIGKVEG